EPLERTEASTGRESKASSTPGTGGIVLYIEDNLSNFRLVERILALRPGIRLISAMQGRMGLDLAQTHRPDLILLDVHLPDISGGEVLAELQADDQLRRIPVVMISADAIPATIGRFLAQGAGAYLTKPLDVKKLLTLLDERLKHPGAAGKAGGSPQRYSS
ncbi:MAG: response regulator, partial [Bacillati bacterium ANGP1]